MAVSIGWRIYGCAARRMMAMWPSLCKKQLAIPRHACGSPGICLMHRALRPPKTALHAFCLHILCRLLGDPQLSCKGTTASITEGVDDGSQDGCRSGMLSRKRTESLGRGALSAQYSTVQGGTETPQQGSSRTDLVSMACVVPTPRATGGGMTLAAPQQHPTLPRKVAAALRLLERTQSSGERPSAGEGAAVATTGMGAAAAAAGALPDLERVRMASASTSAAMGRASGGSGNLKQASSSTKRLPRMRTSLPNLSLSSSCGPEERGQEDDDEEGATRPRSTGKQRPLSVNTGITRGHMLEPPRGGLHGRGQQGEAESRTLAGPDSRGVVSSPRAPSAPAASARQITISSSQLSAFVAQQGPELEQGMPHANGHAHFIPGIEDGSAADGGCGGEQGGQARAGSPGAGSLQEAAEAPQMGDVPPARQPTSQLPAVEEEEDHWQVHEDHCQHEEEIEGLQQPMPAARCVQRVGRRCTSAAFRVGSCARGGVSPRNGCWALSDSGRHSMMSLCYQDAEQRHCRWNPTQVA